MLGKYKVAHLLGIAREHEAQFRHIEKELTRKGYICFVPVFYNLDEYLSFGECPNILDDMCYEKLKVADLCVLVTPEHVGMSTTMRISQSREMGIPVYIFENGELVAYEK